MPKVRITIDGKEILAEEGSNLLEVARKNGFEIPSLCHDPRLEPFGSCRLCLVEIEGARGMVQSCGAKVLKGMVVRTNTENITALRRLAVELLLSEHCGDCVAPCQSACPAGIDIQGFVAHIANGQTAEAARLIREKLPLAASVGRICPRFCEAECRRNLVDEPVSICTLKRFAGDYEIEGMPCIPEVKPNTGKQVAVVGGGPAGLAAAYYLALEGHQVTIFDAAPQLGG
ncbi:FAD-dependent oxidoreductase [Desulforamulus profundi]|uniref:FAD-dependent oxidoreductase n=1 Tax=Desulforamulus profundi TaxID=1383067 RepID=UPI001EE4FDD0|nr:FAD-dependent oxidoreductase [Desulforamulus profundi]